MLHIKSENKSYLDVVSPDRITHVQTAFLQQSAELTRDLVKLHN